MFDFNLIIAALPIILAVIVVLVIITQGYVKAPPDHAFIISGLRKTPRVLIGRAGIKIPFFEQLDKLYLGQITVDIKTDEYIPTNDFINVMVDAVAKVRVADDEERMKLAMRNFLNKEPAKIASGYRRLPHRPAPVSACGAVGPGPPPYHLRPYRSQSLPRPAPTSNPPDPRRPSSPIPHAIPAYRPTFFHYLTLYLIILNFFRIILSNFEILFLFFPTYGTI